MSTTTRQTLDQRRADNAWQRAKAVKDAANHDQKSADSYAREAKKLPIRIRQAGLGAAIAFLVAKAKGNTKDAHAMLVADLTDWLARGRKLSLPNPHDLMESICKGDRELLQMLTAESIAWLAWLTRFNDAHDLPKKQDD